MAKNANFVSHKKSKQKNQDGSPKLPLASALVEGEIAINFAENVETLSILNESGDVVTFSSDNYYSEKKLGSGFTGANSGKSVTDVIVENEEIVSSALNDLNDRIDNLDLDNFFDDAKYEDSGTTKVINFYHGNTIKATIDASDFIVDGMVDDVRIENGNLIIDFNTASGKQDISIPLTDIFDPSNYYNKTEIDNLVGSGFTSSSITNVIIENEEIVSAALTDLDERKLDASAYTPTDLSNYYTRSETSGATEISNALGGKVNSATFTGHTADTAMHFTTTEKTNLDSLATNIAAISGITSTKVSNWDGAATNSHTHSNKAYLDGITSSVGTMAYQDASSYSSATQVNAALEGKVNTSDVISAITPSNSGSTAPIATKVVAENELVMSNALIDLDERKLDATAYLARRTRKDFTASGMTYFVNTLKSAIADQCLEKYGMKVGDYYSVTHDGKTYNYVIAGLNTMKGTSTPYRLNINHIGIIVDTNDTHAWNTAGNTYTSQNSYSTGGTWTTGSSAAGYASCDLHYYLTNTVLPNVKTDLGSGNIKNHYKLYSTAVNTSGYNRFGDASGCASSWAWYANQEICALSEVQVYGSTVWSSSGYDTGEACRQLDVFRVYNMNEIFEGRYPWLRDVASSSSACRVGRFGHADSPTASNALYVAALILFA